MSIEGPDSQDPIGHFNESGVLIEGQKKPRNVLIEKDGEIVPVFGDQNAEQKTEQQVESNNFEAPITESSDNSKGLQGEDRKIFEGLASQEDEARRLLKVRKELGIHTREDERKLEDAEARLNEFMNKRTQK